MLCRIDMYNNSEYYTYYIALLFSYSELPNVQTAKPLCTQCAKLLKMLAIFTF